jgi:hypothetical protein
VLGDRRGELLRPARPSLFSLLAIHLQKVMASGLRFEVKLPGCEWVRKLAFFDLATILASDPGKHTLHRLVHLALPGVGPQLRKPGVAH